MRLPQLILLTLLAAEPLAPAQTGARLAGRVVDSTTGAPVVGALVILAEGANGLAFPESGADDEPAAGGVAAAASAAPRVPPTPPQQHETRTDGSGVFSFAGLGPGRYQLGVRADGYLDKRYGGVSGMAARTVFSLLAGENDLPPIELDRSGRLAGRVVTPDDMPLSGIPVYLLEAQLRPGRTRQLDAEETAITDGEGAFAFTGLRPGFYAVVAGRPRIPRDGGTDSTGLGWTYYPSVRDQALAVLLEIRPGSDLQGTDLVVAPAEPRQISGRVVDASGDPAPADLSVMIRDLREFDGPARGLTAAWYASTYDADTGRFTFEGLPDGRFSISAFRTGDGTGRAQRLNRPGGYTLVSLSGADRENVEVVVGRSATVRGRVRVSGGTALREVLRDPAASGPRVVLTSAAGTDIVPSRSGDSSIDSGTFEIPDVLPGEYWARVAPLGLGPDYFVSEIRANGRDVTRQYFTLPASILTELEIVMEPNAGHLRLQVTDERGEAVAGAQIRLLREPYLEAWPEFFGRSDENGLATLTNIPPGRYRAFAWEDQARGGNLTGVPVTVERRSRLALTIPLEGD